MKKILCILLSEAFLFLSCETPREEKQIVRGQGTGTEREYVFIAVDAFQSELEVSYDAYQGCFNLSLVQTGRYDKYVINEEWAVEKGKHLRAEMKKYRLYINPIEGDIESLFICAGVSGQVMIYADQEVGGRKAGENLADMFECLTKGRIKYPEMDIIADEHLTQAAETRHEPDYVYYNYQDYYSLPIIPIHGVEGVFSPFMVRPSAQYSSIFESPLTLHFVIPITGVATNNNEMSVVLTGTCSTGVVAAD